MKSWIEISGARLVENLRTVQAVAGAAVETLAVVKANGYGHDASLVAKALVGGGARWLGVTDLEEGTLVRNALGQGGTRILVMCGMDLGDAPGLVANGLTPVVWTPEHVGAMDRAARAAGQRVSVHLEIDTGMSRQGAAPGDELAKVLERLAGSRWLACEGVMSHLACAESAADTPGAAVTAAQRQRFAAALEQVTAAGIRPELLHLANTSAVDEGSLMKWVRDTAKKMGAKVMVRTGLALYGDALELEGAADGKKVDGKKKLGALGPRLKPALTWKTLIVGLREVAAGATVGYGATFTATAPMRLALLPVGYADGLRREASYGLGNGWVRIAGNQAAVVGRVSMNLTVVDVTALPKVAMGQEVVLLGEGVTADDHARWCGTIPYEILCGIKAHVHLV
jgi:alanine racemase